MKNGDAAAAAQSYQRGLAFDAKSGDAQAEALDWFNYGQFLRRQDAPDEMVYACFLHAEDLLSSGSDSELATVQNARRQVENKMGAKAVAVSAGKSARATRARQRISCRALVEITLAFTVGNTCKIRTTHGHPSRTTRYALDARNVQRYRAEIRFHHARAFLWHGRPLEAAWRAARVAARKCDGAGSRFWYWRFFPTGAPAFAKCTVGGCGPHGRNVAPGARARSGGSGLRRRCRAAIRGRLVRLRLHWLRLAKFSEPGRRGARNRTRHSARRPDGQPRLFSSANRVFRQLYLGFSMRRARFWGMLLHGRPRTYTYIPDSLRSFVSIADFSTLLQRMGYAPRGRAGIYFRRHRVALGREALDCAAERSRFNFPAGSAWMPDCTAAARPAG